MGTRPWVHSRPKKKERSDTEEVIGVHEEAIATPVVSHDEVRGEEVESDTDALRALETHAHVHATLISSDALRLIMSQRGTHADQMETLDTVIERAKGKYPVENDWMVLNKERVMSLLS